MLIEPGGSLMGMRGMLPYFQVLPFANVLFQNFTFPGIALLCVNGIPNLAAAWLMMAQKKSGVVCGTVFGWTLMAWIGIQFVIFPCNFMSTTYFIFGAVQALTGFAALIFERQEQFAVRAEECPGIGSNRSRLVVYFSRMGYTKKVAFEQADRTGADVYEVKSTERTAGTLGFLWCGRFGMHRWDMPIETITVDLSAYDHVTVCSPVWVFHLAAPMRAFCRMASGKIKSADYILTHFNACAYKGVVGELNGLLGITGTEAQSLCVRWGQVKHRLRVQKKAEPYKA